MDSELSKWEKNLSAEQSPNNEDAILEWERQLEREDMEMVTSPCPELRDAGTTRDEWGPVFSLAPQIGPSSLREPFPRRERTRRPRASWPRARMPKSIPKLWAPKLGNVFGSKIKVCQR